MAPRLRPAPPDLAAQWRRLGSVRAVAAANRATLRTARRWLADAGIDITAKPEGKPMPLTLTEDVARMTLPQLRARYQVGYAQLYRWLRQGGFIRVAVKRGRCRFAKPAQGALAFLREVEGPGQVWDMGAEYAALHGGKRFVIGKRRLDDEELLARARLLGWRGQA